MPLPDSILEKLEEIKSDLVSSFYENFNLTDDIDKVKWNLHVLMLLPSEVSMYKIYKIKLELQD